MVSQSGSKTVVAPDQPHQYAVAVVTDIAAAGLRPGQLPDKGAETDPCTLPRMRICTPFMP